MIGAIFSDLEQPITQISRSRQYSTLNISVTVLERHIYNGKGIGTRWRSAQLCHFQWSWV